MKGKVIKIEGEGVRRVTIRPDNNFMDIVIYSDQQKTPSLNSEVEISFSKGCGITVDGIDYWGKLIDP